MKILVYTLFFLAFLLIFTFLCGCLVRSFSFFFSSVRLIKEKFFTEIKKNVVIEQTNEINAKSSSEPIEMESVTVHTSDYE